MNSSHIADAQEILAEVARGDHGVTPDLRWAARRAATHPTAGEFLRDALAADELKGEFRQAVRTLLKAGRL
ncbi:hypothetical protein [Streptomyces sp. NRRL S-455]|uniref:hypothetical protein n=1 Tax=Streptomyces sp. NRRL S-455 TaxID=1463908 RepID=UPI0004C26E08|nr:hypothetical protein [Streptomyces sp. NRRL S-455]